MSRKRNDSFGRSTPRRARRQPPCARAKGFQGPRPARSERSAGSCLSQRPLPGAREPRFGLRAAWSAPRRRRRRGSPASAPRRRHAPRPAASASSFYPPRLRGGATTYLPRAGRGGHGSAEVGAAWGSRPSTLPLLTGSGLRRDAGGTNGLHYPRGPAIVRRHQAATVVLRAGRAYLSCPALRPLPSGLRAAASSQPRPRGARPPEPDRTQARPRPRLPGGSQDARAGRRAAGRASRASGSRDA